MFLTSHRRSVLLALIATLMLLNCDLIGQQQQVNAPPTYEQGSDCIGDQCSNADSQDPLLRPGNQLQAVPERRPRIQKRDQPERADDASRNQKTVVAPRFVSAPPPTEFQQFVTSSIGRSLPIYGLSLFDQVPTTFAPVDRAPVTADYVIGPGDELLVHAWGQIDVDARVIVDRGGEIYIPRVGAVPVAGVKYEQLHDRIKSAIGKVFRNFEISVNVGQLRSIQVFIVGQARRPGSYTVSSLSTLVNALFASGGPAPSGSMRHIQLKRNDRVLTEFDLYDLLQKGDKSKDVRLLPEDVIYIPPVGAQVALAGSVNVPAIYELRSRSESAEVAAASTTSASPWSPEHPAALKLTRTDLADAIEMAGGLTSTADGQKAVLERIENHSDRKIEEFPLDASGYGRAVKDGDLIRILSVSPKFQNAVTLRGNVARPGRYEWHQGLRVQDLIPDRNALVTREFWNAENSVTRNTDLPALDSHQPSAEQYKSEGAISSAHTYIDEIQPDTEGEDVQSPNRTATTSTTARLRNEIKHNVPEVNWDYALVQRLNPDDLSIRLVSFNLAKAVIDKSPDDNLVLEPGDIVTIFSKADLAAPLEKQTKFVRLEGELRSGVYRVEPGESLRQLVARAGGLTAKAYLYGAQFTRESVRKEQQKALDEMVQSLEKQALENAMSPSAVEDQNQKKAEIESQQQLLSKLRQAKPTGRIVLELKPNAEGVDSLPDIALEDGDRLFVPYRPATVAVTGAVYSKNSFVYHPDKTLGKYLQLAGGATRDADKGRIFVIRADGSVVSKQSVSHLWSGSFESLKLFPGDAVIVPEKMNRGAGLRAFRDWSQIFSSLAFGAAAVNVLR